MLDGGHILKLSYCDIKSLEIDSMTHFGLRPDYHDQGTACQEA